MLRTVVGMLQVSVQYILIDVIIAEVALRSPNTHIATKDAGKGKERGDSLQSGREIDAADSKPLGHTFKTASPNLTFKPEAKLVLKNATFKFYKVCRCSLGMTRD